MGQNRARLIEIINSLNLNVVPLWQVQILKKAAVCLIDGAVISSTVYQLEFICSCDLTASSYIRDLANRVMTELIGTA